MEKFELQKLREIPIESVAVSLGMNVQKHKALCPFHDDKHPSLSFNIKKNTFKCFVCDAHGSVIDLAMHVLGKDFKDTCAWLADEHHIITCHPEHSTRHPELVSGSAFDSKKYERYFQRPFLNAAARHFLFRERKLHPAVIRWCRLNSYTDRHGTPWLQIPYFDINSKLIGVQSRRLSKDEGSRFLFPRGSQCSIYNLPILKLLKEGEALWIAEGASDCWALLSSGRKAIAIPSATLLKASDLDILFPHLKGGAGGGSLHMSPDADIPGEHLYLQLKEHFPQLERHPLPEGCKDFGQYWATSLSSRGTK